MEEKSDKPRSGRAREAVSELLSEWRALFTRCVEEAEQFTRDKPAAGLAAAFLAGLVIGSLIRRR